MHMTEALTACGVNSLTLTDDQRTHLNTEGYLVLKNHLSEDWLRSLENRIEQLYHLESHEAGKEFPQEQGTRRLSNLVNKGAVFDAVYTNPTVLAAVQQVLQRPFKLSSLNARDALPGHGHQGLHADWTSGYDGQFHVCNSLWLLDDLDQENGGTRLVPRTHRCDLPEKIMSNPGDDHPKQIQLCEKAGTVVIFNAHTWHGGTKNRSSDRKRRVIHCYYTAHEHAQQTNQQEFIQQETKKRLSPAARWILDVNAE
jgi:ectoine hydroxylase-related dioxygenase (phytanoyl-CoA dioxygenase family)